MSNKQTRKNKILTFLAVLLVVTFFILGTIIAIIVTEGGKFTRDGIVETGSIRLQIQPSDRNVNIFINDKPVKLESSFINNVSPGEHTVRIESNQFHVWEKQVLVRPALVSNVEARLFPLEAKLNQITKTNIDHVFFSEDGSLAYYLVTDSDLEASERGLWLLRLDDQEIFFRRGFSPLKIASHTDRIFSLLNSEEVKVVPADDGSKLLIVSQKEEKFFVFDPQNSEAEKLTEITLQIGFKPDSAFWFNNNNSIILSNSEIVLEFNLVNGEKTLINYTPGNAPVYSTNGSTVIFYQPANGQLYSYQNKVIKDIELSGVIIPDNITVLRVTTDAKSLLLTSSNVDHYFLDIELSKLRLVHKGSKLIDFSSDGSSAIFSAEEKIITAIIEKIVPEKELAIKVNTTQIDPSYNPHFINNSNLIVFNIEAQSMLQVSENDGSNIVNIVENTSVINGYYTFQRSGSSVVVLITDSAEENVLNTNLFKLNFGGGILPFEL